MTATELLPCRIKFRFTRSLDSLQMRLRGLESCIKYTDKKRSDQGDICNGGSG